MLYIEPLDNTINKNNVKESKIVVFYGPSGSGKTFWKEFLTGELKVSQIIKIIETYPRSLWKEIGSEILHLTNIFVRYFLPFNKIITMTTRLPRQGEQHLVHYRFLTEEEFSRERELGNVLEETQNFGHYYGSNKEDIERALLGRNAVIVLDNKGVKKLKEIYGDRVIAIYMQTNPEEMKNRMMERGETEEVIAKRLKSISDSNHSEAGLSNYILNSLDRIDIIMRHLIMKILITECLMREDIKHIIQPKTAHLISDSSQESVNNLKNAN